MGGWEQNFVKESFDTNWVAPLGPNVDGFEQDICSYTGIKAAGVFTSGTASIHLALILLGVKAGDEVLCQSFTFSASANPITYLGAKPVFIDSEPDTWNMDHELLETAIKERIKNSSSESLPKAIIAVHLYGMPAKMDRILEVANRYGIPVVEDAAEALGSHINRKMCGSFGKLNVLSFNGNKIITTSGGGALLSEDEALISKARFLATQARDAAPHYQHSYIGYNYRMSNVLAGIGRGQMMVLPDRVAQRRANFDFYRDQLESFYGITFLDEPDGYFSNRWLTTILVDSIKTKGITREDIRLSLEAENIESRPLWKPMHMQPIFNDAPAYLNGVSEKLFENGLCLPSGSNLTRDDLNRVVTVIKHLLSV
ncbi:MAG: putative pyridoxal phosphate-dependent enzyme apparently involved in regulation of cell wall biogen [Bacteroidetes bacterium HLUCCA01]|nr:MAG: putative pyridoxal phosphate-dependent enzyme apparently involved in regulation of cell wall biogen [Bacteroidetes bacterium HLUCCA01]